MEDTTKTAIENDIAHAHRTLVSRFDRLVAKLASVGIHIEHGTKPVPVDDPTTGLPAPAVATAAELVSGVTTAELRAELARREQANPNDGPRLVAAETGHLTADEVMNQGKTWADAGQGEGLDYPTGTDGYHSGSADVVIEPLEANPAQQQ
jgi:hypothetical protein